MKNFILLVIAIIGFMYVCISNCESICTALTYNPLIKKCVQLLSRSTTSITLLLCQETQISTSLSLD